MSELTVRDALVLAKARIVSKKNWFGGDNPLRAGEVTSECAGMAIDAACGSDNDLAERCYRALRKVAEFPRGDMMYWNDTNTHATVMAAFDRAIERAREE